jgi:hypothetical protein
MGNHHYDLVHLIIQRQKAAVSFYEGIGAMAAASPLFSYTHILCHYSIFPSWGELLAIKFPKRHHNMDCSLARWIQAT